MIAWAKIGVAGTNKLAEGKKEGKEYKLLDRK